MRTRYLAPLSLATLLATLLWLVLLIFSMSSTGPIETREQALGFAAQGGVLFTLTYINAAIITLLATALFTGLYGLLRTAIPAAVRIAVVFLPAYTAMNLFVYLSQMAVVPRLLALQADPQYGAAAALLAAQMIQMWPGSLVAFVNNLAYAILGIPSIIFGGGLIRVGGIMRSAGLLLVLSGIASIIGLIGLMAANSSLQLGSIAGGGLFLLALFPLTLDLYRERWQ